MTNVIPLYKPAQLAARLEEEYQKTFSERFSVHVRLRGVLMRTGGVNEKHQIYFDVGLQDDSKPEIFLRLNIPRLVLEQSGCAAGDIVEASGRLSKPRLKSGKLEQALWVTTLSLASSLEESFSAVGELSSQIAVEADPTRVGISQRGDDDQGLKEITVQPIGNGDYRVAVIHPASEQTQVFDDFMIGLGDVHQHLTVFPHGVAMNSPRALSEAITFWGQTEIDYLVVIRGGGDQAGLMAFDDQSVSNALKAAGVKTILGVGHSRDRTASDASVDILAATPTNAGNRLAEAISAALRVDSIPQEPSSPGVPDFIPPATRDSSRDTRPAGSPSVAAAVVREDAASRSSPVVRAAEPEPERQVAAQDQWDWRNVQMDVDRSPLPVSALREKTSWKKTIDPMIDRAAAFLEAHWIKIAVVTYAIGAVYYFLR